MKVSSIFIWEMWCLVTIDKLVNVRYLIQSTGNLKIYGILIIFKIEILKAKLKCLDFAFLISTSYTRVITERKRRGSLN